MSDDFSTPRISGSMMASHQGRNVCLMGMAKDVDSNGTSFTLTSCDNMEVKVVMQEPLNEYVAGLVEVHGQVDKPNRIMCHNYVTFPQEVSETFDMAMYNSAVDLMSRFPQHYISGIQQS